MLVHVTLKGEEGMQQTSLTDTRHRLEFSNLWSRWCGSTSLPQIPINHALSQNLLFIAISDVSNFERAEVSSDSLTSSRVEQTHVWWMWAREQAHGKMDGQAVQQRPGSELSWKGVIRKCSSCWSLICTPGVRWQVGVWPWHRTAKCLSLYGVQVRDLHPFLGLVCPIILSLVSQIWF